MALGLCLLAWAGTAVATVSARFDRAQVHEGETLTLRIEAEGLAGGTPDLSVLDADFDVLGTSSGSRIQIVNGRQSAARTWQVTLVPRRRGIIEVPPITVGDEQTPALRLEVTAVPQGATGGPGDDVFLEVEIGGDGRPLLVQQQVPVTVRLLTTLPLRVGELSEPRPEGAVLERLGEDVQYDSTRDGREYRVIERRFSLSPEHSGELRIPPVTFTGELRTGGGGAFGDDRLARLFRDPVFERFGAGLFERGQPVRVRSQALTLQVLPRPEGSTGRWWLPAEALAIEDSWDGAAPELRAGEPVSRTLTITATGLAGSQIPEIELPVPDGVRVYPDGADAETRTDGERLFGVSRQRVTLMPTAGGRLRFPEIRLRWWDVSANRERTAVVPQRILQVAGSAAGTVAGGRDSAMATDVSPADLPGAAPNRQTAEAQSAPAGVVPNRLTETRRPIAWVLLAAVGLTLLALFWRGLRRRGAPAAAGAATLKRSAAGRSPAARAAAAVAGGHPDGGAMSVLRAACDADDARAAAAALLALARRRWGAGSPSSLGGIAARLEQGGAGAGVRAAAAIRSLEAVLYGPAAGAASGDRSGAWEGRALAAALPDALDATTPRRGSEATGDVPLAPLYPPRG
jgi:hypothetical protein